MKKQGPLKARDNIMQRPESERQVGIGGNRHKKSSANLSSSRGVGIGLRVGKGSRNGSKSRGASKGRAAVIQKKKKDIPVWKIRSKFDKLTYVS